MNSKVNKKRGWFFVLEGIDGSGTTTQIKMLAQALRNRGAKVHTTAEPSEGPVGKFIRAVLRGETSLSAEGLALAFAADRIHHIQTEIQPKMDGGHIVLSDRYVLSSLVYQSQSLPVEWVREINKNAIPCDQCFLLDIPSDEAAKRRASRGEPDEIFDAQELQKQIANTYQSLITDDSFGVGQTIDGSKSIAEVNHELMQKIGCIIDSPSN
ncbi:MAG: dTMP kinase [Myxococcota bacterium]|nr:dTMP kinase [Myxococcota bacterium]